MGMTLSRFVSFEVLRFNHFFLCSRVVIGALLSKLHIGREAENMTVKSMNNYHKLNYINFKCDVHSNLKM